MVSSLYFVTICVVYYLGQPQAGARTQLLKGNATTAALLGKGGTVGRAIVTDTEMAALLKRQQQIQQQQKAAAAANAASSGLQSNMGQQQTVQIGTGSNSTGITTAQFLAQAGLQVYIPFEKKSFKQYVGF